MTIVVLPAKSLLMIFCLAYTGAEDSESEDMAPHSAAPPVVANNKIDKLPGRRYNLNTDVLPIMRHVCADGATSTNIQVQGFCFFLLIFVYLFKRFMCRGWYCHTIMVQYNNNCYFLCDYR